MQEQPPSDPPRREPTGNVRRSRSPKPTFTPPPTPEPAVPPARQPGAEELTAAPPRRTKPAPPVLFQPPESDQAADPTAGEAAPPRPRRTPADAAPTGQTPEDRGTKSTRPGAEGGPEGAVSEPAAGEERKPGGRATPKKATPAPRKRAGRSPGEQAEPAGDLPHTAAEAGGAEPTGPVSSTAAAAPDPTTGPESVATAPAGPTMPGSEAKTPTTTPRKSATRGTTAKTTGTTAKKTGTSRKVGATAPKLPDVAGEPTIEAPPSVAPEPDAAVPAVAQRGPLQPTTVEPSVVEVAGVSRAETVAVVPRTPGLDLRAVRARVLDHPGFAPELLALAAVEALGPRARDWAERLREAYPDADADGLARLAARRFVRLAGTGGAVSAVAGLFAPVAELATVLWTQANLVLHLAAAYGHDPVHPDRAVELLVLTRVHPDADSARTALDAARAADGPGEQPWPRAAEAARRLAVPLAAQAGGWLGLRLASRLLPGAAVLVAAAGDAAAAERLAARAVGAYRPARVR